MNDNDNDTDPMDAVGHLPVTVHIVADDTQKPGTPRVRLERPVRLNTARYTMVTPANGAFGQQIAGQNPNRDELWITADINNTGVIYICDELPSSPTQLDNVYALAPGGQVVEHSTHQIFAFGTDGDFVYVKESGF